MREFNWQTSGEKSIYLKVRFCLPNFRKMAQNIDKLTFNSTKCEVISFGREHDSDLLKTLDFENIQDCKTLVFSSKKIEVC